MSYADEFGSVTPPRFSDPLEERDMSETGPDQRVYIHRHCGQGTVVGDSSLQWVCSPMRMSFGSSVCATCGLAVPDDELFWADTGESVEDFRKRMSHHTPAWLKWLQRLVLPLIIGILAAVVVPSMMTPNRDANPTAVFFIFMGIGFFAGFVILNWTPLAHLFHLLIGLKYRTYR